MTYSTIPVASCDLTKKCEQCSKIYRICSCPWFNYIMFLTARRRDSKKTFVTSRHVTNFLNFFVKMHLNKFQLAQAQKIISLLPRSELLPQSCHRRAALVIASSFKQVWTCFKKWCNNCQSNNLVLLFHNRFRLIRKYWCNNLIWSLHYQALLF